MVEPQLTNSELMYIISLLFYYTELCCMPYLFIAITAGILTLLLLLATKPLHPGRQLAWVLGVTLIWSAGLALSSYFATSIFRSSSNLYFTLTCSICLGITMNIFISRYPSTLHNVLHHYYLLLSLGALWIYTIIYYITSFKGEQIIERGELLHLSFGYYSWFTITGIYGIYLLYRQFRQSSRNFYWHLLHVSIGYALYMIGIFVDILSPVTVTFRPSFFTLIGVIFFSIITFCSNLYYIAWTRLLILRRIISWVLFIVILVLPVLYITPILALIASNYLHLPARYVAFIITSLTLVGVFLLIILLRRKLINFFTGDHNAISALMQLSDSLSRRHRSADVIAVVLTTILKTLQPRLLALFRPTGIDGRWHRILVTTHAINLPESLPNNDAIIEAIISQGDIITRDSFYRSLTNKQQVIQQLQEWDIDVILPFIIDGTVMAMAVVGGKITGDQYTRADYTLLQTLYKESIQALASDYASMISVAPQLADRYNIEMARLSHETDIDFFRLREQLQDDLITDMAEGEYARRAITSINDNPTLSKIVSRRYEEFIAEHHEFQTLSLEERWYLKQAVYLLLISEITNSSFQTEIVHNLQRLAEVRLLSSAGEEALVLNIKTRDEYDALTEELITLMSKGETEAPNPMFFKGIFMSSDEQPVLLSRINHLKQLGVAHYIIRSQRYEIPTDITNTWKICAFPFDESESFLVATKELANIRNRLIHESAATWNNDPIDLSLHYIKVIMRYTPLSIQQNN